jgi:hypothetical protein
VNPFVFIVGCQRSGTTVLQRVVNAHPRVAVMNQSGWIPDFFRDRTGLTPEGFVTPLLVRRLLKQKQFRKGLRKAGLGREHLKGLLAGDGPVSYAAYVSHLFDLFGRVQGKDLVGDKTPRYVRSIPTLHELWPEACFVHLIRDGRDVGLSTISKRKRTTAQDGAFVTWGDHPVVTAALKWEWNVRLGREAGQTLGPALYYEMRYEDLVARPAEECARLCDFLGIAYDGAMLRFHEGRTRGKPGLDAKKAWRPITPGLRDWRTQMAADDVECFEAAAGPLLDELRYPRGTPVPAGATLRYAAQIRELFVAHVRTYEGVAPEGW